MQQYIKTLSFIAVLLFPCLIYGQSCGNCKSTPSVALYNLDVQVPPPGDKEEEKDKWLEWRELFWFSRHANSFLFKENKSCIRFIQPASNNKEELVFGLTHANIPTPGTDVSQYGDYLITGAIKRSGDGYIMEMELQASCTRKVVASARIPFTLTVNSDNTMTTANQAVAQLSPLIDKIRKFELEERIKDKSVALASLGTDQIKIKPNKKILAVGEETELELSMQDCDGYPLPFRELVFTKGEIEGLNIPGTTGGTVTPNRITTGADGKAKVKFKMGSAKTAFINVHHKHNKPAGCSYAKLGSATIGAIPIKIELTYWENEMQVVKPASPPGTRIRGGEETTITNMAHTALIYHYPSQKSLKDGFLVDITNDPDDAARSTHLIESGYFENEKNVEDAFLEALVEDKVLVKGKEGGSLKKTSGVVREKDRSEVSFYKGDINNPAEFSWSIEYDAGNGEIAGGTMLITKGSEGVKWQVNKINSPGSDYKTEYILELRLDAEEEYIKGNKAVKDVFGTDSEGLTSLADPTKKNGKGVSVTGSKTLFVRILSPYEEK